MAALTAELPDYFSFSDEPRRDVNITLAFLRGLAVGPLLPLALRVLSTHGIFRLR